MCVCVCVCHFMRFEVLYIRGIVRRRFVLHVKVSMLDWLDNRSQAHLILYFCKLCVIIFLIINRCLNCLLKVLGMHSPPVRRTMFFRSSLPFCLVLFIMAELIIQTTARNHTLRIEVSIFASSNLFGFWDHPHYNVGSVFLFFFYLFSFVSFL